MSRTLQITQMRHAQKVNREINWQGHLWHSRFYSTIMDDLHMWTAIKYVEQNPVRAKIVLRAEDYLWSSAAFHCSIRDDSIVYLDERLYGMFDNWSLELGIIPDTSEIERLRKCTLTGEPYGDEKFVKNMLEKTRKKNPE